MVGTSAHASIWSAKTRSRLASRSSVRSSASRSRSASALSSISIEVAPRWMIAPPSGTLLGVGPHLGHQVVVDFGLDRQRAVQVDVFRVRCQIGDLFGPHQPGGLLCLGERHPDAPPESTPAQFAPHRGASPPNRSARCRARDRCRRSRTSRSCRLSLAQKPKNRSPLSFREPSVLRFLVDHRPSGVTGRSVGRGPDPPRRTAAACRQSRRSGRGRRGRPAAIRSTAAHARVDSRQPGHVS